MFRVLLLSYMQQAMLLKNQFLYFQKMEVDENNHQGIKQYYVSKIEELQVS